MGDKLASRVEAGELAHGTVPGLMPVSGILAVVAPTEDIGVLWHPATKRADIRTAIKRFIFFAPPLVPFLTRP